MNDETFLQETPYNNRLLKADEVASRLNVSRSFAYSLMKSGQLPSVHLGRALRVNPRDLEKYIKLNTTVGFGKL